ncbi:unnamed protein product [Ectocarpus sp. 12 AP-2014]
MLQRRRQNTLGEAPARTSLAPILRTRRAAFAVLALVIAPSGEAVNVDCCSGTPDRRSATVVTSEECTTRCRLLQSRDVFWFLRVTTMWMHARTSEPFPRCRRASTR